MRIAVLFTKIRFVVIGIRENLWIKPLIFSIASTGLLITIAIVDHYTDLDSITPQISESSVETLLSIMASSMLAIATFSVASMVTAYSSASNTASPRSIALIIADDRSQFALSWFIGSFIFSTLALIALKNNFFNNAGIFALFVATLSVFAVVIIQFLRWVDSIARLGRLGNTIDKVEDATQSALHSMIENPAFGCIQVQSVEARGHFIKSDSIGYLQHIDTATLQNCCEEINGIIRVAVQPGTFITHGHIIAYLETEEKNTKNFDYKRISDAFIIGKQRVFDDDPRYGLIVLSQIADRALSPGVNDPGTAIDIISTFVRLFSVWIWSNNGKQEKKVRFDRVEFCEPSAKDMFDDAFIAIERDGSGTIEVTIKLIKSLSSLAAIGDESVKEAAIHHTQRILAYAEKNLPLPEDLETVRNEAKDCITAPTNG
ncbi:MAG: DUF2254 domain-containing protein [Spirochaetes bacterium]|jgi:uncharacterized membrane protein|nr:DUF2254 domain-containing protein [Spirochaetota bacterium]